MAFRDPSVIQDTCKCNYFSKYRSCYTATVLGNIFKPGHLCGVYGLDLYDHGMCGLISFQEEIWKGGIRIQVAFVPVDAFDFYWDFDLVFDQYADREAGADDCGAEFDGVGVAGVLLFQDEAEEISHVVAKHTAKLLPRCIYPRRIQQRRIHFHMIDRYCIRLLNRRRCFSWCGTTTFLNEIKQS